LRHATNALRCPEFDICWRYSDILNNTTICIVLLFFTGSRGWKVMPWLFGFVALIYVLDKYLLLEAATTTVYDTTLLSSTFARWWCIPTALLAALISFWGYQATIMTSVYLCVALPVLHIVGFLIVMFMVEEACVSAHGGPLMYDEAAKQLRGTCRPWDFFNTNPVFCLRTRCLGPKISGWEEVAAQSGFDEQPQECVPFSRGSVWLLKESRKPVLPQPQSQRRDRNLCSPGESLPVVTPPASPPKVPLPTPTRTPSDHIREKPVTPIISPPRQITSVIDSEGPTTTKPPSSSPVRSPRERGRTKRSPPGSPRTAKESTPPPSPEAGEILPQAPVSTPSQSSGASPPQLAGKKRQASYKKRPAS